MIDVTAAIIEKKGKVLAARRKTGAHLAGYWEFPGGKLEKGETPEACLRRELAEEFCIETKVGSFVGESVYDYGSKVIRLLAYRVEHIAGEFELIDHDELCWLCVDELDSVEWAPADVPLVEQYRVVAATNSYYQQNAAAYCEESSQFSMTDIYPLFLDRLKPQARILDLGCGSGRDSKAFIHAGFDVTALDACAEVAAIAEEAIGQPVVVSSWQDMAFKSEFDGVWACASLLHCPRAQLLNVLQRVAGALKADGLLYMSFKWGENERADESGRYFNNYTSDNIKALLGATPELALFELWVTESPLRGEPQKWVNVLARRT